MNINHSDVESARISFLEQRDGIPAARVKVREMLAMYHLLVTSKKSHASLREYREGFIASLQVFISYLGVTEAGEVLQLAPDVALVAYVENLLKDPYDTKKEPSVITTVREKVRRLMLNSPSLVAEVVTN
jgi:hypothetical protein